MSQFINYAEPRATVKTGINCDIDYAKSEMKQIRTLYGKDDRVQAHLLIQSFRPGEITDLGMLDHVLETFFLFLN